MKYLIQGGESAERLQLLLQLTNIESLDIVAALHRSLCHRPPRHGCSDSK